MPNIFENAWKSAVDEIGGAYDNAISSVSGAWDSVAGNGESAAISAVNPSQIRQQLPPRVNPAPLSQIQKPVERHAPDATHSAQKSGFNKYQMAMLFISALALILAIIRR